MATRQLRIFALALAALLFAGCAPAPPLFPVAAPSAPAGFPEAFYREAAARGEPVFSIDAARSQVLIRVYRGGSLGAKFGHDHLVSSRAVRGYALLPAAGAARVDLYLPLDSLAVDDPERLVAERMPATLSAAGVEATRRNMLGAVLDAAHFPYAVIHGTCGSPACTELNAQITLHGVARRMTVPLELERNPRRLVASGHFDLRQTDFGITPYSALGGALLVRDRLDLSFRIEAASD